MRTSPPRAARSLLLLLPVLLLASCASVEFKRRTQTSGTFRASGTSLTIVSIDIPRSAADTARGNVRDVRQPNTRIENVTIYPYLGPFDWLLDIIGIRYAVVKGTWGFDGE